MQETTLIGFQKVKGVGQDLVPPAAKPRCFVLSVAEWIKAPDLDASAGGESPGRTPVRAATLCLYV